MQDPNSQDMLPETYNTAPPKLGLYSLVASLVLLAIDIGTSYISAINNSNSFLFLDSYNAVMVILCLGCILALAIPSFKKSPYPNLTGLIGLVISLYVMIDFLILLVGTLSGSH